jgi:hypothetical protein
MSTEGAMAHQYQVLEELGEFPKARIPSIALHANKP